MGNDASSSEKSVTVDGKTAPAGANRSTSAASAAVTASAASKTMVGDASDVVTAAQAAAMAAAAADLQAAAEHHSAKLGLPFTAHPYAISDASHRVVRLHGTPDARKYRRSSGGDVPTTGKDFKGHKWVIGAISNYRLDANEIYCDVCPKRGTLRFWTRTIWTSPLFVYREKWEWASKVYTAGKPAAERSPAWQPGQSAHRRLALETFAAADRAPLSLAPSGLSVLVTNIEWPSELPDVSMAP